MDEYSFKSTHDCCWATLRGSTKEYDLTQLRRGCGKPGKPLDDFEQKNLNKNQSYRALSAA